MELPVLRLTPGLTAAITVTVAEEHTAQAVGSGTVRVLATPELVRLLEQAAVAAMADLLPAGQTSVGTALEIRHLAPTPVGLTVTARATLKQVDGRQLIFDVEAHDAVEKIGEGTHTRVLVDHKKFEEKATSKVRG